MKMKKVLAAVMGITLAGSALLTGTAAEVKAEDKKLVFWDKSEYVSAYNDMMKAKLDEFAEKNGVDVEYVIIPSGDLKQKLAAAIESGNQPDLIMGDNTLVAEYVVSEQLAEVSDVLEGMDLKENAKTYAEFNGKQYLVPLSFITPGMYIRKDKWEEKGLDMPTTYEELKEQAKLVNDPENGFYALGIPLGASGGGDAETFIRTVILTYGGKVIDENGEITVNSPETLEAFKYLASLYEEGLCPPDAATWDDSANNSAWLAGTVGMVTNSGSIVASMEEENQELLANTQIIKYPAATEGGETYALGGANVFGIFETGKNTEVAKDFVSYYFQDGDYYNEMIEAMGSMWQPVINGYDDTEFWKQEKNVGWLENSQILMVSTYPAPTEPKVAAGFSNQLCTKTLQQIVVNGEDPQEALDNLEETLVEMYAE
ncbi:MAG: sugar ABC transporter substrate-binding protein [Eubacteriales bacterium]|nr:sugar ABC transporter substrate-binding protein [Eubacteriales bacterium]